MSEQRKGALWDAIRLAAEGTPKDEFLAAAITAKEEIIAQAYDLWREVSILDHLVARIAPDASWETGWNVPSRPAVGSVPPRQTAPDRNRKVLDIAKSMVADGATKVSAKAVAEILRSEGFQGSVKDLTISVGNILARAKGWRRIKPGEYELVK